MAGIITYATIAVIAGAILVWLYTPNGKKWLEQL